ncbi:kelch-like protein 40b [Dendronephthya gigantea]|uniref:kelch-like protein 40b n=1 Tax=Dendronephthya gigantea TaxID=151771 RepID=UPI00106ADC61|nr:kelch-like protein 40b [Dendronephthya gigantea]
MRKEIDELTRKLENKDELNRKLMADVARQNVVIDDLNRKVNRMTSEVKYRSNETRENGDLFTGRRKIFVCGGRGEKCTLKTVESFSWPENIWTPEPAMNIERQAPASFLYESQIYVSGGWTGYEFTDIIEMQRMDQEWIEAPVKMPIKCRGHGIVCNEDKAILTGGRIDEDNISDGIYEIKLTPPYTTKLLTQLPERRYYHGCQIIDNEVVVVGGRTTKYTKDTQNTVYAYDINNNECKTLSPLPFPIAAMATVSYKGNVVLIGGHNEKGRTLNTVFMYEVKTGKIKMLPCLNHKRAASAAAITGNIIVVMGGYDCETKTCLSSVECLDLSTNEWRKLPPMTSKRGYATAVLIC